jgi:hypothetical protein
MLLPSFASIVNFPVAFSPNPINPDVITLLNSLYSGSLPDVGDFFTDPVARTTVKSTDEIRRLLLDKFVTELILPAAADHADPDNIHDILYRAPMNVEYNGSTRRLGHNSLTFALDYALATRSHAIHLTFGVAQIEFATLTLPGLHYYDWCHSTPLLCTDSSAPPPSPPTAHAFTPADLSTKMADLKSTISAAVVAGVTAAPTAPTVPSSTSASSQPPAPHLFNYRVLPSDVRSCYQHKLTNALILGSWVKHPFAAGNFYHLEGVDKIILSDGTLFVHTNALNEKDLLKAPLSCDDDTPAGVRSWYSKFVQCCIDYGFYAHPLWCFRPDHGGERGFTAGSTPSDDLPDFMDIKLHHMSQPLFRLLSCKDMFPKDSTFPSLVASSDGDGFCAIKKNILFSSHPAFHDQPSTLVTRKLSLFQFAQVFKDYLQLRAYIQDTDTDLDHPTEVDIFISHLKHADFVNRVTCEERRHAHLAHKHRGSQLIETIMKYLMAPARATYSTPSPDSNVAPDRPSTFPPKYSKKPYTRAPVNVVTPDTVQADYSDDAQPPHLSLGSISVPPSPSNQATYHQYCASVLRIQANPTQVSATNCIVCHGTHRFDACPVLLNTEFLHSHYIRYCQQLKLEASACSTAFPTSATTPAARPIRRVLVQPAPTTPVEDDLSVDSSRSVSPAALASDFQFGRV